MYLKYYDLLSTVIIGVVIVTVVKYLFFDNLDVDSITYITLGFFVGYFINSIGSILEHFYYKLDSNSMPSENLLTPVDGKECTGYKHIKFYEAEKVTKIIKYKLKDENATTQKMFEYAKRKLTSCDNNRVYILNSQYALARTMIPTVLVLDFLLVIRFYKEWYLGLIIIVGVIFLVISWKKFKERGYYYAREVLNEYLNQIDN